MGAKNSLHVEHLYSFINFLRVNNISEDIIKLFIKYHYADGTLNNKGNLRMSTDEFRNKYPSDVEKIKLAFSNDNLFYKLIDRFILQGLKSDLKIDGILYCTVYDFIFIPTDELIKILKYHFNKKTGSVNVSSMYINPMARCINRNPRYEYCRLYVQVKWYNIFDDYIKFKTGY